MTFDPKTNRIPTGLLTPDELAALKNCGGPWAGYIQPDHWVECSQPAWLPQIVYRQDPAPLTDLYIPPAMLELLDPVYQWFAANYSGNVWAFTSVPEPQSYGDGYWNAEGDRVYLSAFPSVRPGTKPWDQSLISRADLMKGAKG